MDEVKIFNFPTENDGIHAVEEKLCELLIRYRTNPNNLDPLEIDFMDWANSVLITSDF